MNKKNRISHKDIMHHADQIQEEVWDLSRKVDRLIEVLVMLETNKKNKETLQIIRRI